MRFYAKRAQLYEQFKAFDQIHDPSIYNPKPEDSKYIELKHYLETMKPEVDVTVTSTATEWRPPMVHNHERIILKNKIRESYAEIRHEMIANNSIITPRTQAHNRKCSAQTVEEDRAFRSDALASQISSWRAILPKLFKQFSKIPDPRRTKSVEHKLITLMIFGLFAFVFRLQSRREMNRELTGPVIQANLKKIFPDLETIPHADTLARLLKNINPKEIQVRAPTGAREWLTLLYFSLKTYYQNHKICMSPIYQLSV